MITIIIPCFNEEKYLRKTFFTITAALKISYIKKFQIIIIDDGSTDNSFSIMTMLMKKFKNIKIIKNKKNLGLGSVFFKGVANSKFNHLIMIPADNSHPENELVKILRKFTKEKETKKIVTTFYINSNKRSFIRKFFTNIYTPFLNLIFGTNFKYFNGLTVYPTKVIKNIKIYNSSFSYQIEIFVKLSKLYKYKFFFVPTILKDRKVGSKAFRFKNSLFVFLSIFRIFINSIYYRLLNIFYKFEEKRNYI
jgi:glycosyltransferase involved in cell wall biosynthesis